MAKFAKVAKALGMDAKMVDGMSDEDLEEKVCAMAAAMRGEVDALKGDAEKKKAFAEKAKAEAEEAKSAVAASAAALSAKAGEAAALSTRITVLEQSLAARDQADCEREVADVVALAAAAGRPDAFDADAQKFVRDRWAKDRPAAQRELGHARAALAVAARVTGAKVVRPADEAAQRTAQANNRETKVALAKAAGARVVISGETATARMPDGREIALY